MKEGRSWWNHRSDPTEGMSVSPIAPYLIPRTPKAWMGRDLAASPDRWAQRWTDQQLDDLLGMARRHVDDDLAALDVQRHAPSSLRRLAGEIRTELIDGLGFRLLEGYPVGEVDRRLEAVGFLLMGRLLGSLRSQNAAGHLLGHVKDVGRDPTDPSTRIYQTNHRQGFHTDSADCVVLLCRTAALSGGRSLLASAETALAITAELRPDLAPVLFEPLATDRRGEIPEGADPWFGIPVLSWYREQLTVQYQRTYIDSASRLAGAPRPTSRQVEAMDLWDEILDRPDVHLTMDLEPGDMQFVHNHSLLHDRTAFVDRPEPSRRRHLLRLWVSLPGDRELPPVFAERYGALTVGDRGGIEVPETRASILLDVEA